MHTDNGHTHARTHAIGFCELWGFSIDLYDFYTPNYIFYPLTLNLPLTENLFAMIHFQINIIYYSIGQLWPNG